MADQPTITPETLSEVKRLLNTAPSPLPWRADYEDEDDGEFSWTNGTVVDADNGLVFAPDTPCEEDGRHEDCELAAAGVSILPDLIASYEAVEQERRALRSAALDLIGAYYRPGSDGFSRALRDLKAIVENRNDG